MVMYVRCLDTEDSYRLIVHEIWLKAIALLVCTQHGVALMELFTHLACSVHICITSLQPLYHFFLAFLSCYMLCCLTVLRKNDVQNPVLVLAQMSLCYTSLHLPHDRSLGCQFSQYCTSRL